MTTLTIFLAGFSLATFAWGIFCTLIMMHRPRGTAPTKRRMNRERLPEVRNVPPMPVCKVAREEGCDLQDAILAAARKSGNSRFVWETEQKLKQHEDVVRYEWINLTGEER
jgi:hypothetical protein